MYSTWLNIWIESNKDDKHIEFCNSICKDVEHSVGYNKLKKNQIYCMSSVFNVRNREITFTTMVQSPKLLQKFQGNKVEYCYRLSDNEEINIWKMKFSSDKINMFVDEEASSIYFEDNSEIYIIKVDFGTIIAFYRMIENHQYCAWNAKTKLFHDEININFNNHLKYSIPPEQFIQKFVKKQNNKTNNNNLPLNTTIDNINPVLNGAEVSLDNINSNLNEVSELNCAEVSLDNINPVLNGAEVSLDNINPNLNETTNKISESKIDKIGELNNINYNELVNKMSELKIDKIGELNPPSNYTELKIGELNPPLNYTELKIDKIGELNTPLNYTGLINKISELKIDKIGELNPPSNYTELKIDKIGELNPPSNYTELKIGELNPPSNYTKFKNIISYDIEKDINSTLNTTLDNMLININPPYDRSRALLYNKFHNLINRCCFKIN